MFISHIQVVILAVILCIIDGQVSAQYASNAGTADSGMTDAGMADAITPTPSSYSSYNAPMMAPAVDMPADAPVSAPMDAGSTLPPVDPAPADPASSQWQG